MAHFDHQPAVLLQMIRRVREDAPHEVESVAPAGQREPGFTAIFRR